MLRMTGFAVGMLLATAAYADEWSSTAGYDQYEAERLARNAQLELEQMRVEQSQRDMLDRQRTDDYRGPTYVPYRGYQTPYWSGPYVGTGR